jgi:hypothetical protein
LLHEFHHQHSFPVPENSCHQLSGRQTTFVKTFSACLVNEHASTAFIALWFRHSQMKLNEEGNDMTEILKELPVHLYFTRLKQKKKDLKQFPVLTPI